MNWLQRLAQPNHVEPIIPFPAFDFYASSNSSPSLSLALRQIHQADMSKSVAYTIAASALIGLFVAHAMPQASEEMETSSNAKL